MSSKVEDDDVIVVNESDTSKNVHVIASSDDSGSSSDESEKEISETNLTKESNEHKDEQSKKHINKDVNTNTVNTVDKIEDSNEPLNEILMETSEAPAKIADVSQNGNVSSSLALLATYDTDSDNEENITSNEASKIEVNNDVQAALNRQLNEGNYRVISDDSSSDDESDVELSSGDEDSDVEEVEVSNAKKSPIKAKGEFGIEDLPPIEDLKITVPEDECIELGKIISIVSQLVLVDCLPGSAPLDLDTVIFLDKGTKTLGRVFDVLGNISTPLYCVRFNSYEEIVEKGIEVGRKCYVAPRTEHTQFIILSNLMKEKGCDASWKHDIEPPPKCMEYSDDEEERAAKRGNRGKRALSVATNEESVDLSRQRPVQHAPNRRNRGRGRGRGMYQNNGHAYNMPPPGASYQQNNYSWHSNLPQQPQHMYPNPYAFQFGNGPPPPPPHQQHQNFYQQQPPQNRHYQGPPQF